MKYISEVAIGDKVLAFSTNLNSFIYSEVVAVPHDKNDITRDFIKITTSSGKSLTLTPTHLLVSGACGSAFLPLKPARQVKHGHCVMTTSGQELVESVAPIISKGVYTIVTNEEYVVVSGFVASPFETSHYFANIFIGQYMQLHQLYYNQKS
jgi:hypothetical protein